MGIRRFRVRAFRALIGIMVLLLSAGPQAEASVRGVAKSCAVGLACVLGAVGCASNRVEPEQVKGNLSGVPVVVAKPHNHFPGDRMGVKANPQVNFDRALKFLDEIVQAYPEGFLKKHLDRVYVTVMDPSQKIDFPAGQIYAFGRYARSVYLFGTEHTLSSADLGWTRNLSTADTYAELQSVFHHEVGHSVYHQYASSEFRRRWKSVNGTQFQYRGRAWFENHPDRSVRSSLVSNTTISVPYQPGFASAYALVDDHEDFAETVALVFDSKRFPGVWNRLKQTDDPLVQKIEMVLELYGSLDPRISLASRLSEAPVMLARQDELVDEESMNEGDSSVSTIGPPHAELLIAGGIFVGGVIIMIGIKAAGKT